MIDTNRTTTIIGIAGSLRRGSFNAALLRAAAEAVSPATRLEIASIREIPLYDGDVEAEKGVPDAVQKLKDRGNLVDEHVRSQLKSFMAGFEQFIGRIG